MEKGLLIIISGFSGAGKGSLAKGLMSKYDNYALSVSATTRKPRVGEVEGKDYFFVTNEEFESKIGADELIEYAKYVNNYYGTPRDYVEQKLNEGKDVILEIEMQGALKVKVKYPDTVTVFVSTKDAQTLKKRLHGRGTETLEQIDNRLIRAIDEADLMNGYDYLVINDDMDEAIETLHNIVKTEHHKMTHHLEFITEIQKELKSLFAEE